MFFQIRRVACHNIFGAARSRWRESNYIFLLAHGVLRVDDGKGASGIIHVIRNGLRGRGAPPIYWRHKIPYNRFIHWSKVGVSDGIFALLVVENSPPDHLMTETIHLKVKRTACVFLKGACSPFYRPHQR